MKPRLHCIMNRAACVTAIALASLSSASAQLSSQYGILDLAANGGINPSTGNPWQAGDQYRLAFYTEGTINGTSNDPAVYDDFATAQANLSTLGDGSIQTSTGWTAMVWVNTDPNQAQGAALSNPSVRSGIDTGTGGPVYAMDGTTAIARDNSIILSGTWRSPFADVDTGFGPNGQAADSAVRLPVGATTAPNTQNVHYSPFLDQFGAGDSGSQHGVDVMTGGFPGSHVNAVGDITLAGSEETTFGRGSSNANNTGRVWNRFTDGTTTQRHVYAISPVLSIIDAGDTTPPTLAGSDIVDDKTGGPVQVNETVTYTVTFSEAMDAGTVEAADFENNPAATATTTVDSVSATGDPAVYEVVVTPTGTGTINLQVKAGADLKDIAGNALTTTSAIADDTTITVTADIIAPTVDSFADNVGGGPILTGASVTYTVAFSEAMNASTVNPADFENNPIDSATITVDSVTPTGDPAVFEVVVTATGAGTLNLQVAADATLQDPAGNALATGTANPDDTIIQVDDPDLTPPTVVSFDDDVTGGPIALGDSVLYAVTFSEAVSGVDPADFDNAGTASITVDSVTPTGDPASFDVLVTATGAGNLQLQIASGASIEDTAIPTPNALNAGAQSPDDTIIEVTSDTTPPTVQFTDGPNGAITVNSSVTYTLTFSEAMDAGTIGTDDFGNGGTSTITVDGVAASGDPAVFEVTVTATTAGTLILQIEMGADLRDLSGNALDTSSAIPDFFTVDVNEPPNVAGQYGILDVAANGGINPNTGNPWQPGDQYRLAFHTDGTIDGTSNDPADYDNFATAQAQQNAALATSTGWTALVWVNTDPNQAQGAALSDPTVRAGINDFTGGAGVGGAGVPVYAMDGATCIARNNADIDNNWSNPFAGDAVIRLGSGTTNLDSDGNPVTASQNVHYSPFLDQFGLGDTANVHGADVMTGGIFDAHVNAVGDTIDDTTFSRGSSNANNTGRIWNRFTDSTSTLRSVYAISPPLTVVTPGGDGPVITAIVRSGTIVTVTFTGTDGATYDLNKATGLDGTFPDTPDSTADTTTLSGTTGTLTDSNATGAGAYYQVKQQ